MYANTFKCGAKNAHARRICCFVFFAVVCHLSFYFVCFGAVACRNGKRNERKYKSKHNFCVSDTHKLKAHAHAQAQRNPPHQPTQHSVQKYKVELSTRKRIGNVQRFVSVTQNMCDVLNCWLAPVSLTKHSTSSSTSPSKWKSESIFRQFCHKIGKTLTRRTNTRKSHEKATVTFR